MTHIFAAWKVMKIKYLYLGKKISARHLHGMRVIRFGKSVASIKRLMRDKNMYVPNFRCVRTATTCLSRRKQSLNFLFREKIQFVRQESSTFKVRTSSEKERQNSAPGIKLSHTQCTVARLKKIHNSETITLGVRHRLLVSV